MKKWQHDTQTDEKSRALPYDPTRDATDEHDITAPSVAVASARSTGGRSPIMMGFIALTLLGSIILAIVLTTAERDALNEFSVPDSSDLRCFVQVEEAINIRVGPDLAYERAWILSPEIVLEAHARTQTRWLQLANGWIYVEDAQLSPAAACDSLPVTDDPVLFQDDLPLPDEVEALNWFERLGDSFATDVNGWAAADDGTGVVVRQGALVLLTDGKQSPSAAPQDAPFTTDIDDAYVQFSVYWVANDATSRLFFDFRQNEQAGYRLVVGRDGTVQVLFAETLPNYEPISQPLSLRDLEPTEYDIGVLMHGALISIFVNGERVQEVAHDYALSGYYQLGLQGQQATLYIPRFELLTPPPSS